MTPSVDLRIASMARALSEIILPALAETDGLAKEQAGLVLGHLMVLREQFDYALRYEKLELLQLRMLGQNLQKIVDGGEKTKAVKVLLDAALSQPIKPEISAAEVRTLMEQFNLAIEELMIASGHDGAARFIEESQALMLAYGTSKSTRDRVFFKSMRFEAADSKLPEIPEMMAAFESEMGSSCS